MSDFEPMLPDDPDVLEWDGENLGGDESLYDGEAVSSIEYDDSLFDEETEPIVVGIDE